MLREKAYLSGPWAGSAPWQLAAHTSATIQGRICTLLLLLLASAAAFVHTCRDSDRATQLQGYTHRRKAAAERGGHRLRYDTNANLTSASLHVRRWKRKRSRQNKGLRRGLNKLKLRGFGSWAGGWPPIDFNVLASACCAGSRVHDPRRRPGFLVLVRLLIGPHRATSQHEPPRAATPAYWCSRPHHDRH